MGSLFSDHKLAFIGIIALVVGGVWLGLSSSPPSPDLVTTPMEGAGNPVEQGIITTLLTFRSVELDPKILSSPAFTTLKDFSTQIIPEPIGRENPFAPLQYNPLPASASTTKSTQIFKQQ